MTECPKGFKPHPYPYHFELNLKIESLTNLGLGIGRDKDWVIQVPYTLPGEKVTARIYRNHSNYSVADCLQIIEASPNRISLGLPFSSIPTLPFLPPSVVLIAELNLLSPCFLRKFFLFSVSLSAIFFRF